jgi:hypothetical protein
MASLINDYEYNQGGYGKYGIKREYLAEVRTRTRDDKGRVYRGEAGQQLLRRRQEQRAYYERNK